MHTTTQSADGGGAANRRRRLVKLAAATLAVAATVAGVSTETASAVSVTKNGCVGKVQVPVIKGYNYGAASYGAPTFVFPTRFVWRSTCYSKRTQVVTVRYRLWGYMRNTQGWQKRVEVTRSARVRPGYGAWIRELTGYSPNADISGDVLVKWKLTNGRLIGSKYLNYNAIGDYRCVTVRCGVFPNAAMGAFIHFVTGY